MSLYVSRMPRYLAAVNPAPAAPETTAAAAQKFIKTISGDKVKTQSYCDIGKLGSQIEDAEQRKDMSRIDELKMDEMATKLGPEYVALMITLEGIDPNSKEALEVGSVIARIPTTAMAQSPTCTAHPFVVAIRLT